ncbi:hypothetical protein COV04_04365 [Candidatus Uhrbacteria bacterium CG10_big_fil_rev_8_21_14_0_10_48_11]|uniref:ROK family protein n=1 Tax=Candidatus Uhrbacteria bacterium CG10_big_fil_rev_8_21_14_0_10_48_11 TaxID=1975037 RepID=A0A2M8LDJ3_9BACT|nr:MAG: hypothetical protein COV04_04365 [Candidatus Uhrbacteria bacterium CG10_big_fil_rev_8_21_14_0_10_48_11]
MTQLLFDVGGTKTRIAIARNGVIGTPIIMPTEKNFDRAIDGFVDTVKQLGAMPFEISAVAGGVRSLDKKRGVLRAQPHFPLWVGKPLRLTLAKRFGAPVYLENDAALAALGEAVYGAGKNKRIVAYLTVSTGVGGAIVIDKHISESMQGFEPGNQIIGGTRIKPLRLEAVVSGKAFERRYKKPAREIKSRRVWQEAAQVLALGIHNSIVHWSPEVVVLGGGLLRKSAIRLTEVSAELNRLLVVYPKVPQLNAAQFGDESAIYGGLALILQQKKR